MENQNINKLNFLINYIEDNLHTTINYKELAKILCVNEYTLHRIFYFISGVSLAEYIRKRRLSKAFEELKTSNIKIIDLALKYQYDSSTSFSRAFKNMFNITPTECRNSNKEFKQFPILKFDNPSISHQELNYKIENLEEIKIYYVETHAKTMDDFRFNIRKLYREIKKNGLHKKFNEIEMYGVSFYKDDMHYYYVGSKKEYENTKKLVLPSGKYAIFNVGSREQKDIIKTLKIIYTAWLPSTNYVVDKNWHLELYIDNNCYLYIPIKDI